MSVAGSVLTCLLPESPKWLVTKGKKDQAFANMKRFRTNGRFDSTDLDMAAAQEASNTSETPGCGAMCQGVARKALFIGIGLMFVQQWSGINAVMFYCGTILENVFPDPTLVRACTRHITEAPTPMWSSAALCAPWNRWLLNGNGCAIAPAPAG